MELVDQQVRFAGGADLERLIYSTSDLLVYFKFSKSPFIEGFLGPKGFPWLVAGKSLQWFFREIIRLSRMPYFQN